jgi:hypothetical protein
MQYPRPCAEWGGAKRRVGVNNVYGRQPIHDFTSEVQEQSSILRRGVKTVLNRSYVVDNGRHVVEIAGGFSVAGV